MGVCTLRSTIQFSSLVELPGASWGSCPGSPCPPPQAKLPSPIAERASAVYPELPRAVVVQNLNVAKKSFCQCNYSLVTTLETEHFRWHIARVIYPNRISDLTNNLSELLVPLIRWRVHHTGHIIVVDVHLVQRVLEALLVHWAFQSCMDTFMSSSFLFLQ